MERKSGAPRPWDMGEVFLSEGLCGCPGAVAWERKLVWYRGEASQDASRFQYRITFGKSVEIQQEEAPAVEHDMLQVEIAVNRGGRYFFEARSYCVDNLFDIRSQMGKGYPNEIRVFPQDSDLVLQVM